MAYGEEIKICIDKIIKNKFPNYNIKSYLVFGVDFYIRCHMHLKSEQICIYRPGYDLDLAKKMYPENLIFIEGKGIILFNNGGKYEGDLKNDQKEGKGIYYYNNGDRYEGEWKNNLRKEKRKSSKR